jgi:hypothetical protein
MENEKSNHIILLHDHDETREMVPDYYKLMIEYISDNGVVFETPACISLKK